MTFSNIYVKWRASSLVYAFEVCSRPKTFRDFGQLKTSELCLLFVLLLLFSSVCDKQLFFFSHLIIWCHYHFVVKTKFDKSHTNGTTSTIHFAWNQHTVCTNFEIKRNNQIAFFFLLPNNFSCGFSFFFSFHWLFRRSFQVVSNCVVICFEQSEKIERKKKSLKVVGVTLLLWEGLFKVNSLVPAVMVMKLTDL